jgi:hypothetical protein
MTSPVSASPTAAVSVPINETQSYFRLRAGFWAIGITLAVFQAWTSRYFVTTDAVAYMDMSDGVLRGQDWHRLINGTWSPLYPALLGLFRRIFQPSDMQEIAFDHLLNIPIFLFAFAMFEFLLSSIDREFISPFSRDRFPLPHWAFLALGYALFIWASISAINLESLRPDMLMSGFLYLAIALLVRQRGRQPSLGFYAVLGVVLGVSYLVKAPMLPIGMVILAVSVLMVKNRRRAIPMAACSAVICFLIGTLYFVPLSRALGHFTLGESGRFNYIIYADHAGPDMYLTNGGTAAGVQVHRTRQIFNDPPAYEFSMGQPITHPLRFDPSYWTQGLRPAFRMRDQINAMMQEVPVYRDILLELAGVIVGFAALWYFRTADSRFAQDLAEGWPLWVMGVAGFATYAWVHVESRYIGAFFVLFWLGLIVGVGRWRTDPRIVGGIVIAIALSLFVPTAKAAYWPRQFQWNPRRNVEAAVAGMLPQFGIHAGDPVARISTAGDLGWARTARVTIIAEIDWQNGAKTFWKSDPVVQAKALEALHKTGAKCVVAHVWTDVTAPGWYRVGGTRYWIYPFN